MNFGFRWCMWNIWGKLLLNKSSRIIRFESPFRTCYV